MLHIQLIVSDDNDYDDNNDDDSNALPHLASDVAPVVNVVIPVGHGVQILLPM